MKKRRNRIGGLEEVDNINYTRIHVSEEYSYQFKEHGKLYEVCNRLLDENSSLHDENYTIQPHREIVHFLEMNNPTKNVCSDFKSYLDIDKIPITPSEKSFPLAFSMTVYKDVDQVARLLRMIYREQNFYAIHVDRKSPDNFYDAIVEVQKCFGKNVHVIPRNESMDIRWATFTQVETDLLLPKKLLKMGNWKYNIKLTGQEFPLRTNLEIVKALIALNGSNLIEGLWKRRNLGRFPDFLFDFPVYWVKGSALTVLTREFTEFMIFDRKAIAIADVLKNQSYDKFPDETFTATLAYNPQLGAPGACLQIHEKSDPEVDIDRLPSLARYVTWDDEPCPTKFVRSICILGSKHLNILFHAKHLFANKFIQDYFPVAYDCIELMVSIRAKFEQVFNASIYGNLYCSKHHI